MEIRGNRGRNRSIDFIKGICILFVIITHYSWSSFERQKYLFPFWIEMAVPLFMIISGFVYTESYKKSNIKSFEEAYSFSNTLHRVVRYTMPFAVIYFIEMMTLFFKTKTSVGIIRIICYFLRGGFGPGSYYYPVMIQFIFFFPIIFFIIKKYAYIGLLICGFMNFT